MCVVLLLVLTSKFAALALDIVVARKIVHRCLCAVVGVAVAVRVVTLCPSSWLSHPGSVHHSSSVRHSALGSVLNEQGCCCDAAVAVKKMRLFCAHMRRMSGERTDAFLPATGTCALCGSANRNSVNGAWRSRVRA